MTKIADHAFSIIQAAERRFGCADVGKVCGDANPDIDQDWDRERTIYTFDDGSQIIDEGDLGCWVSAA